ncbi:hypothetical protein MP638_001691 [Amoeboaphelidium occidentale]|nr:hypothetical protein MP638_001691 [Amoeboaphelidium occidentale]
MMPIISKMMMDQCRQKLKDIGWSDKDTMFEDIEMDGVFRCYIDTGKSCEFADPAKILRPNNGQKSESSVPTFTRKISDSEMNEDISPNSSIVVEFIANPSNLVKKLMQLEKYLLFLFLRHQKIHKQSPEAVESIISYVAIVIPYRPMKKSQMDEKIQKEMLENQHKFPLLYRLYEIGRFIRYFINSGMKAAVTELADHVAENSSVSRESVKAAVTELAAHVAENSSESRESSQLSLETKKIVRLDKEIMLARNISQTDPSYNEKLTRLVEEAKRMLTSSEEDNDE